MKCVDGRCQMQAATSARPSHPARLVEPPGLLLPPPPRSLPPPPPASWSHQVYSAVTAIALAITAAAGGRPGCLVYTATRTHACTDARVPARFPAAARQVYPHASRAQGNGWEAPFVRIVDAFKKKKERKKKKQQKNPTAAAPPRKHGSRLSAGRREVVQSVRRKRSLSDSGRHVYPPPEPLGARGRPAASSSPWLCFCWPCFALLFVEAPSFASRRVRGTRLLFLRLLCLAPLCRSSSASLCFSRRRSAWLSLAALDGRSDASPATQSRTGGGSQAGQSP